MIIEYQLAKSGDRRTVDLRPHAHSIISASRIALGSKIRGATVFQGYFRLDVSVMPSNAEIRDMGKEIVATNGVLNNIKSVVAVLVRVHSFLGKRAKL